jgi:chorismate-pyruvate lyase
MRKTCAFVLCLFTANAWAADAPLARLKADLLGKPSATQVLTDWCANLHIASPAVIHAQRDHATSKPPAPEIRALLQARPDEAIHYRRVKLACGSHVLSEADNWYRPSVLTAEMNTRLNESDTPFGTAVKPLNFHRRTLDARSGPDKDHPLEIRALLLTPAGVPFSLVVEDYSADLIHP